MFDIGFSELLLIGVVALVVIGPERLPGLARTAGHLLGRLQRYVNTVKTDIHREIQIEELKKIETDLQASARSLEYSIQDEVKSLNESVQSVAGALETPLSLEATPSAEAETVPSPTLESDAQTPKPPVAAA